MISARLRLRRTLRGGIVTAAALVSASLLCAPAFGQAPAVVLVVSQPAKDAPTTQFVDLSPHLQPVLQESGKYRVVIFSTTHPQVQDALKAGRLSALDIQPPVGKEASHKIAKGVGAGAVLHVSATAEKTGVSMSAELEVLVGQNTWNQVYVDQVAAPKSGGKRVSLLESVHAIVERIAQKLTTSGIDLVGTAKPRVGESTPLDNSKPTDNSSRPQQPQTPGTPDPTRTAAQPAIEQTRPAANAQVVSTYTLLIDRARRNGDIASLIVALRKAITERPQDVRLRRDLAAAYKDRGKLDLAREEVLRATAIAPEDGTLRKLLGDLLLESGDRAGALKEYQEAVKVSPQDGSVHMALGDALMADGQAEEALKEFQASAAADSKSPLPHMRIARLSFGRGAQAEALAALGVVKPLMAGVDVTGLVPDCIAILTVAESTLLELLPRLQQTRVAFNNGTKTREEAFMTVTAMRKRADELSALLDALPEVGLGQPQALFGQAASLAVQSSDKLIEHLETQSSSAADESSLLRVEANKQIAEASKRLKALTETTSQKR